MSEDDNLMAGTPEYKISENLIAFRNAHGEEVRIDIERFEEIAEYFISQYTDKRVVDESGVEVE